MFTNKEIAYLKNELGLTLDYDNLSDDDLVKLEDAVATRLAKLGFDEKYEVTSDGIICENILDKIP